MNDPAWLAAERDYENSESISVVVVSRTELTRLRTIVAAAREYVELLDSTDLDLHPDADIDALFRQRDAAHDALVAAVGAKADA